MDSLGGDLLPILELIEREKGISKENLLKLIEQSIISAFKKHNNKFSNIKVNVNINGHIEMFAYKKVVVDVKYETKEISLADAKLLKKDAKVGDEIEIEMEADSFGRIAAQTAKQVIIQKMRETEKSNLYKEYKEKEGNIVNGYINKIINGTAIIDLGKVEAILPVSEQIQNENYVQGMFVKAYILKVEDALRGIKILISRKSPQFLKKLFEIEIPEIYDGTIEIKNIARDAGNRAKVAVYSKNPKVDPIGSSVGVRGVRIKNIIDELNGEKIDLILYNENPKIFIENSLKPAKIDNIYLDEAHKNAEIILTDDQLSLAIGKQGSNVKLAARLTGWHLEIKTNSQRQNEKDEKIETAIKSIEQLDGISAKSAGILISAGYTLDTLKSVTKEDLLGLQGIGEKTANNILKAIKNFFK
ncbi:MAG: transcription termination factor NusA [Elusimicrobiota bacterium]|nr:transcription termination factor NusA [Elusimicrobiota bacterium]